MDGSCQPYSDGNDCPDGFYPDMDGNCMPGDEDWSSYEECNYDVECPADSYVDFDCSCQPINPDGEDWDSEDDDEDDGDNYYCYEHVCYGYYEDGEDHEYWYDEECPGTQWAWNYQACDTDSCGTWRGWYDDSVCNYYELDYSDGCPLYWAQMVEMNGLEEDLYMISQEAVSVFFETLRGSDEAEADWVIRLADLNAHYNEYANSMGNINKYDWIDGCNDYQDMQEPEEPEECGDNEFWNGDYCESLPDCAFTEWVWEPRADCLGNCG
jgi:hypothetical protein